MDISKLIKRVKDVIYPNGVKAINAQEHQALIIELLEAYNEGKSNTEHKHSIDDIEDLREVVEDIENSVKKDIEDIKIKNSTLKKELDATKEALKIVSSGDEVIANKGNPILLPTKTQSSIANSYQVNGLTVENLVENGDFSKGDKGWKSLNCDMSFENGSCIMDNNSTDIIEFEISQTLYTGHTSSDDLFYMSFNVDLNKNNDVLGTFGVPYYHNGKHARFLYRTDIGDGDIDKISFASNIPFEAGDVLTFRYRFTKKREYITSTPTVSVGSINLANLTQLFGKGDEPSKEWCDMHLANYIDGIKSVNATQRVKAIGKPNQESSLYINSDTNLRSVGINRDYVKNGELYKNIERYYFTGSENWVFREDYGGQYFRWSTVIPFEYKTSGANVEGELFCNNFIPAPNVSGVTTERDANTLALYRENDTTVYLTLDKKVDDVNSVIPKGTFVDVILPNTEITTIQTSGQLVLKPNGTIFSEPIKMGAEIYDGGIKTSLPIVKVESLAKFDMETGNDVEIDESKAVIDKDKSTLTHPDLKDGDMIFLEYLYDDSPIIPELEIESFNSDKVLEDKTTGDLYSWGIEIESGEVKLVSNKVANKIEEE